MPVLTAPPTVQPALGRTWPDDYPPVHSRGLVLRPVPQDVRVARRFARDYCASRGIPASAADSIELCLSEVVTDAVIHALFPPGRRHLFVQLSQRGPFVTGAVFDPDCRPECLAALRAVVAGQCPVDDLDESGRGLAWVVRPLSCGLSVGLAAHGLKCISFDVDCLPSKTF